MTFLKKALAATAVIALGVAGISALGGAKAAEKFKAAWIYIGPTGDMGWSYQHYLGQQAVEKEFGDKVQTTKVENVPESADAERVLTQLAQKGNKIIFTTSFGYMEPTLKVAKAFPKVYFEHATGYKTLPNVSTYNIRFYEGRTVQGTMAGMLTKSGIIGYVGSVPIPEVIMGIDAFTLALRKVRPDAKVKVIWANEWFNPGKEADAAKALLDQGADVICQHTDSPAPVQTAEARGAYAFGQSSDMAKFGPTHEVTSNVDNWAPYYIARVKAAMDGTWKSEQTWGGLASGMLSIPPINKAIPADVAAAGMKVEEEIKAGKLLPFAGPIKDQSGKEIVPAGAALSDDKIAGLDWYVEGVDSKMPTK
jgi:simple sugar transport system substrate-binding protein